MGLIRGWLKRLEALLHPEAADRRLDEEMEFHLARETERNIALGMAPDEARRQALVAFGGVTQTRETHREVRRGLWLEEIPGDVKHAFRALGRSPVFAATAILTLAVGIGANTAIFSVVRAVILRPLPFAHPEQLVMLSEDNPEKAWHRQVAAPANYLDWKERVHAFQDVAAYTGGGGSTLTGIGDPKQIRVRSVTGNFFSVLGVTIERGRGFTAEETWSNHHDVAVVSHRFWRNQLSGDPQAVGRTVMLDGSPVEIVGILPEGFVYAADSVDLWGSMGWKPADRSQDYFRRAHWLRVIARLRPGVTPAAADAEFQTVVHQLQTEYPLTNRVMGADLVPLQEFLIGDLKAPLLILQAAVGLLLLIACANVANLLLAQAVGREREMSLRLTLGARQGRLVRQAMTESLVLAALGGTAGFVLGWWGTRALAALQPAHMLPVSEVPMDLGVLAWVTLVTTLTGLLFGIAPALWSANRQPAEVLREGSKGSAGIRTRRWTAALVAFEVAVALVLTIGAGLLVRSFWRLTRLDPGLDPNGVLVVAVRLPNAYDTTWKQLKYFQTLLERTQSIPGVTGAGLGTVAPFGSVAYTSDFHIAGRPPQEYGSEVARDYVTPDYFRALDIPLKSGRYFDATDRQGSAGVVIINEALARQYFGGQDPVGQRITFDRIPDSASVYRTIVGVVGDVRQRGLALEPQIEAYEVLGQQSNSYMTLVVHAPGDQPALLTQVRNAMASVDPEVAPAETWQLSTLVQRSIAQQRFLMVLLLVFAATGVVLAVVGVYGLMAQLAARRTREMGIRLALGAQMAQVRWLVLREAVRLLAIGLGTGLLVAYVAGRGMRALLYEIAPADPVTFLAVTAMLIATGLVASWVPAVRASRADPATSLRAE